MERLNRALAGRYEIERELGQGGMAMVYLAADLKHERKVALKVLRPELAAVVGAERFLAEIKTTANLQHPHILPLFDSGEADGFLFYVMPHIDGETLGQRIARETQLPVDEAVRIAVAVANALQVAHDKGIIHRDIKPGNILLSGTEPLVADFGIALAVGAARGNRLTETGLSVGTPYYMSPEQATGDQNVGPPSDVYALACVLYEMLVGEPPYPGNTAQAVLGRIIQGKPVSAADTRASVPAHVDAAIRKALEKLPADRFRHARDFASALRDPGFRHGEPPAGKAEAGAPGTGWKRAVHAGITVALAGLAAWALLRPSPASQPVTFELEVTPIQGAPKPYALAPDGSFLVFNAIAGPDEPTASLHVRRLGELGTTSVPGTENGITPTVSPTGTEVAFIDQADRTLKVVPLQGGGVTRKIADSVACCPSWESDDRVYYTDFDGGLRRVSGSGDDRERLVGPSQGAQSVGNPGLTASGDAVVFTVGRPSGGSQVEILRLSDGKRAVLLENVVAAQPTESGHLVFVDREGRLVAARLDEKALRIEPDLVEIAEGLRPGSPWFDISATGTLVYLQASSDGVDVQPVWVDRSGTVEVVDPDWTFDFSNTAGNRGFSLSPDGSKVATSVGSVELARSSIWIKQLPNGAFQPLTPASRQATRPRWTPLGDAITYLDMADLGLTGLVLRADFVTPFPDTIRFADDFVPFELQMAPGGDWIAARFIGAASNNLIASRVDGTAQHVVETPSAERAIALSPDGKWLAYESNESGITQVYVRSFPDLNRRLVQVSTSGGSEPRWGRSGGELFYIDDADNMVAVEVQTGDVLQLGAETVLFRLDPAILRAGLGEYYTLYDADVDDQRFLMMRSIDGGPGRDRTVMILNVFELLARGAGN
jgi:serine/threonine-protein kinase